MRRLLVLAAGVLATAAPSAGATTIEVTTTFDTTVEDGKCSLREAVGAADLDAALFGAPGECPAGAAADTVVLAPGSYDRTAAGIDDNNTAGDLDVTGTLTIAGAGAALTTIDAKGLDRVLDVISGATLTIQGVTITGGAAADGANGISNTGSDGNPGANATGGPGTGGAFGGGVQNGGTLVITDSIVTGNRAGNGGNGGIGTGGNGTLGTNGAAAGEGRGGQAGDGGDGGGIWSGGSLTLTRVLVSDNHAGHGGTGGTGQGGMGGLGTAGTGGHGGYGTGGLSGFGGDGGGIHAAAGTAKIDSSTIRANTAGAGGTGGQGKGGLGGAEGPNPGAGGAGGGATGAVGEDGGSGAGINSRGTLVATRDLVDANSSGQGGAGGAATGGKGGNTSNGTGGPGGTAFGGPAFSGGSSGGIQSAGGTVTDTTLTSNRSGDGGTGGSATGGNGGAGTAGTGAGGDAFADDGGSGAYAGAIGAHHTAIVHATITGNTLGAGGNGGAATAGTGSTPGSAAPGTQGSSFSGSAISPGAAASLRNSILAGNAVPACSIGLDDLGGNVSLGDSSCPGADLDPLLGPLADNGGPTLTRRPEPPSPVRDRVPGADAGCTATDQRGAARPGGAGCETGAYEIAAPVVLMTQAAPAVAGTVNPNARATTYHFEFGTSTAYGAATPDASLPAGVDAVAVGAALDGLAPATTYHVRLVATNLDGTNASEDATFTTAAQGGGGAGDTTAPAFLSASMKPKTFAVNRKGAREKLVTAKVKRGTTFRYRLSEAARVVFTIQRRHGKRFVQARRFAKVSKAGANTKKFSGRIGERALKPGRYRATLVATDAAGNRSKAKRLTFKVLR